MIRLFFLVCFLSCVSCVTAKREKDFSLDTLPTILNLPTQSEISGFYPDPFVQFDIELASPDSLRRSVHRLYTVSQGLSNEKLLSLTLAVSLMRMLYPLEPVEWNVPRYKTQNIYLAALADIEKNIYPQLPNINSFFDAVIPALILTKGIGGKEYGAALESRLLTARSLNPQSILPFYLLGLLYEQLNRLSDAEAAYQIVWERDPSCYPAGMRFAWLALRRNNIETALEVTKALYERYPHSVAIRLLLAEAYIESNNLNAAEDLVYALLKKEPNQHDAFFLRIRLYIEKKEYLPATALLDEYAKKNKVDKKYLLLRMRVLREWSKNSAEAKQCLEQAESLYPLATDVVLACAEFCFDTRGTINGKNAGDFIDVLLQQGPRNILAIRLLVKHDIAEKQWVNAFERAQYLYTNNPSEEHLMLYTRACIGMKKWNEAVNTARIAYTAVKSPSNDIIALYLETLYGANEFLTIKQIITRYLPTARSSLKSVLLYYQALLETNEEEKLDLLRLSLLSDPRSSLTLFALYEWYFKHKDYRKASYYLQQVVALDPDNRTYIELSNTLDGLIRRTRR